MANVISDKITTKILITEAEFLTLVAQRAQQSGLIDYSPDSVVINPDSVPAVVEGDPDVPGYMLTFTGPRPA